MAVDQANVRADLLAVSVAGNEYHVATVALVLGGTKIPIRPLNIGEVVGYLQGARNFEIEVGFMETAPAVIRTLTGFDGSGTDDAPAVGTACPQVEIRVWDPQDTNKLAQIIAYACVLMETNLGREGAENEPATITCKFMVCRNAAGKVWSIGAGT